MSAPNSPPRTGSLGPVLFVSYSAFWGGAARSLLDIAGGLKAPVTVLCPAGQLASRAAAAGLPVLTCPAHPRELRGGMRTRLGAVLGLAAHAREVRIVAASLRPRAIVASGMRSGIACAAALRTVPAPPPLLFEHVDFLPSPGVAALVRAAARRAERVITPSNSVAIDLDPQARLGERLRVAAPGVDLNSFDTPPPALPATALLLGAIAPWKRPDLALEAVAVAARRLPDLRLVVAGDTLGEAGERLLESLRRRADESDLAGRVEFAGALADPRPALAGASCLLHCADREPFGLVLLEAMASARPVVAPAAGGPLEIVTDRCGRLFSPGDAQAAATALVEILDDREGLRRSGEQARLRVAARYTLEAARQRWLEAAPEVVRGTCPGNAGDGLTLVTVSHNSEVELERLLASVARHLPAATTVVVDSGSNDDSTAVVRGWGSGVQLLELDNVGYGRAANAGVAQVRTPACIVLNPDIELVDDSLAALALEATRPGAPQRLLAPLVLRPNGNRQPSVSPEPLSLESVLAAFVPPAALPAPLRGYVQPWRSDHPRRVAWATGCCVGAATDTLRRLGPFDERIFLYAEDLDLGLRAADAGVETWWWPQARLIHFEAHASRRTFGEEPFELLARQRHAVMRERRGERMARWDDRVHAATLVNRMAIKTLLMRSTWRERRQLTAVRLAGEARLQGTVEPTGLFGSALSP